MRQQGQLKKGAKGKRRPSAAETIMGDGAVDLHEWARECRDDHKRYLEDVRRSNARFRLPPQGQFRYSDEYGHNNEIEYGRGEFQEYYRHHHAQGAGRRHAERTHHHQAATRPPPPPRHIGRTAEVHAMPPVTGGHAAALRRSHDTHACRGRQMARNMRAPDNVGHLPRREVGHRSGHAHGEPKWTGGRRGSDGLAIPNDWIGTGGERTDGHEHTHAAAGHTTVCEHCGRRKHAAQPICMHCAATDTTCGKTRASLNRMEFVLHGCDVRKGRDNNRRRMNLGDWDARPPRELLKPLSYDTTPTHLLVRTKPEDSVHREEVYRRVDPETRAVTFRAGKAQAVNESISRGDMTHTLRTRPSVPIKSFRDSRLPPKLPLQAPPHDRQLDRGHKNEYLRNGRSRYHYGNHPRNY
eukprot:m.149836 g.149836  ORF g.149836 m.149836 type:complete len:410 (+) comp14254_c0_seq6:385-1614(+)